MKMWGKMTHRLTKQSKMNLGEVKTKHAFYTVPTCKQLIAADGGLATPFPSRSVNVQAITLYERDRRNFNLNSTHSQ